MDKKNIEAIQYMVDFLSITLDLEKPFVLGDKMNDTYIANNKTKIINEAILCENYEVINFLIEIFKIDEECISDIINFNFDSNKSIKLHNLIKWLSTNNLSLFEKIINKLIKTISIVDYDIILVLKNIFNKFDNMNQTKELFEKYIYERFFNTKYNYNYIECVFFSNFDYICFIIEILQEKKQDITDINLYLKFFDIILLNKYTELKFVEKYIKYYGIKMNVIREHFISKEFYFIELLIKSKSLEKITWFFEIIPDYTVFIKKLNYLELFEISCKTYNIEVSKYIYNIIELCGFEIAKKDLSRILCHIIYSQRWNKDTQINNIVFELINFGIKPPSGYPQLIEYYNNIKIYS